MATLDVKSPLVVTRAGMSPFFFFFRARSSFERRARDFSSDMEEVLALHDESLGF